MEAVMTKTIACHREEPEGRRGYPAPKISLLIFFLLIIFSISGVANAAAKKSWWANMFKPDPVHSENTGRVTGTRAQANEEMIRRSAEDAKRDTLLKAFPLRALAKPWYRCKSLSQIEACNAGFTNCHVSDECEAGEYCVHMNQGSDQSNLNPACIKPEEVSASCGGEHFLNITFQYKGEKYPNKPAA